MYDSTKVQVSKDFDDKFAHSHGLLVARDLITALKCYRAAVVVILNQNHVETVGFLLELVAEATSKLSTINDKREDPDANATERICLTRAFVLKCQFQVIQLAKHSLSCPDQTADLIRRDEVQLALDVAISFIGHSFQSMQY
ncbi:hypothetical protein CMQ_3882 [Grosmannia clavigera kw1407]|uniref:Uncharacterized protein n=1 Tax=Grosmannia clavigera (strain kw1407 / UAMH 11150) TaxID=655863 RepID=F0X8D7_GROCL|nr:uncharacterized protein CMQ_3882 [Grosmannia clavigera kw1407]EFX05813.1 hypothetical protein CMQ_3882 [Grosmannia clavigera kw1407]